MPGATSSFLLPVVMPLLLVAMHLGSTNLECLILSATGHKDWTRENAIALACCAGSRCTTCEELPMDSSYKETT